jgi:DNA-binding LacI/PurR family transcriptional regulator
MVTIYDIAERLNVSHATVSRALRNSPAIALATRERIQREAARLKYRPNVMARGLTGGATHTLGVVWPLSDPGEMARRMAIRAQQHEWVAYTADTMKDAAAIQRVLTDFIGRGVDAAVVELSSRVPLSAELEECLDRFRAAVVVAATPKDTRLDQVVHDRSAAIRSIVQHFVRGGRTAPGILIPAEESRCDIDAYLDEFARHGIYPGGKAVIDVRLKDVGTDRFPEVLKSLCASDRSLFDCLFCYSDELAMIVVSYLKSKGLDVPRDVAVVGANDGKALPFMIPPMASVVRKDRDVADAIERLLFSRLEDPLLPARQETVAMEFVWRESAGARV